MQSSNKHWRVILGIVGSIIVGLLAVIAWKLLPSTVAQQVSSSSITAAVSEDAAEDLITAYYQAIVAGNAAQVKAAWATPDSRQARYAVQAMQDFPDARCHPQKVEKTSPDNESDASVSVNLECNNSTYAVIFQLKASQPDRWKIIKLQRSYAP